METNDWLDEVLYQTIPSLDLAMLCKLETQAVQEEYDFSAGFEKRMRRLIREERRKWRTEDRGMKDREPETTHIRWPSFPIRFIGQYCQALLYRGGNWKGNIFRPWKRDCFSVIGRSVWKSSGCNPYRFCPIQARWRDYDDIHPRIFTGRDGDSAISRSP